MMTILCMTLQIIVLHWINGARRGYMMINLCYGTDFFLSNCNFRTLSFVLAFDRNRMYIIIYTPVSLSSISIFLSSSWKKRKAKSILRKMCAVLLLSIVCWFSRNVGIMQDRRVVETPTLLTFSLKSSIFRPTFC